MPHHNSPGEASELFGVEVRLYGMYRELAPGGSLRLDLPAGSTVDDLVRRVRQLPGAERLPDSPAVAVNLCYAHADQRLGPDDEVALIPPVAGG